MCCNDKAAGDYPGESSPEFHRTGKTYDTEQNTLPWYPEFINEVFKFNSSSTV